MSLAAGVTKNVLLELDDKGDEDICKQVVKLSEDTWRVPEQEVSDVFVVIVEEFISLENVTDSDVSVETDTSPSFGDIDLTTVWKLPSILPSSLE